MLKIKEIKGHLFRTTLTDGSTLTLSAGQEKIIKEDLVSDSLRYALSAKRVSATKVKETATETKPKEEKAREKSGGAK